MRVLRRYNGNASEAKIIHLYSDNDEREEGERNRLDKNRASGIYSLSR